MTQTKKLWRLWTRVYPTFLVVVFLLVLIFVVWPALRDINQLRGDIIDEQARLEQEYQQGQSMRRVRQSLELVRLDIGKLDQALLKPGQELDFILLLERAASEAGLSQNINLGDLPDSTNLVANLPVTVTLDGSFSALINFLDRLERQPIYINWHSVAITAPGSFAPGNPPRAVDFAPSINLRVNLSGLGFWQL
jgi:Tfp pilus assembly protein PilO